jgi:hypothetical protein
LAILKVSYAEFYYTKVVDNGAVYHLINLENFRLFDLLSMKKRRDSATVTNGSKTVDG